MRGPLTFDPVLAAQLANAADEIFAVGDPDDKDLEGSLDFLSVDEDATAAIETLFYACRAMMDLFTAAQPDRPVCDTSDDLAVAVCQIWGSPEHQLLAQALLRAELDEGSLADLPDELRATIDLSPGSELSITLVELILGMSAMLALEEESDLAGTPLRKVFSL